MQLAGSCQCTDQTHSPAWRVPLLLGSWAEAQLGRPVDEALLSPGLQPLCLGLPTLIIPVVQRRPGSLYSHYNMGVAPEPLDQAFWDLERKPHGEGRH